MRNLDFSSRDTLRKRVDRLARRLNLPENLVAAKAVELADKKIYERTCSSEESKKRKMKGTKLYGKTIQK